MRIVTKSRSVVSQGSSYYISLPLYWVKSNAIQSGDKLKTSIESDGSVRILVPIKNEVEVDQ